MTEYRPLNTSPLRVRLRLEDYLLLDRSGAFEAYAKTELMEGEVFFVNAQHRPHARIKMKLYDAIRDGLRAIDSTLSPMVEASFSLPPDSVPEPDIVLTSEPDGEGLIPLSSVFLVIEVSDTTLDNDLGKKARVYAGGGIPEYWVADVKARIVHQLWSPQNGSYTQRRTIAFGLAIIPETVPGLTVPTATL